MGLIAITAIQIASMSNHQHTHSSSCRMLFFPDGLAFSYIDHTFDFLFLATKVLIIYQGIAQNNDA